MFCKSFSNAFREFADNRNLETRSSYCRVYYGSLLCGMLLKVVPKNPLVCISVARMVVALLMYLDISWIKSSWE
jgi:hypothetical protein